MSFLIEVFAKEWSEKIGVDYRRIAQGLASWDFRSGYDVRLELSGLEDIIPRILPEYEKFLVSCFSENNYKFEAHKLHFTPVGSEDEILKRIEIEMAKKREIVPYLIEESREFSREVEKEIQLDIMCFLRGSGSPKTNKIFLYYKNGDDIIFVSDVDLTFLLPYVDRDIINLVKELSYEFSLKNRIPINPWLEEFNGIDNIFNKSVPVYISYERIF